MMKWLGILGSFLLILSFQNCQKSDVGGFATATSITQAAQFEKSQASDYPTLQIWDYDQARTLDVNLNNGRITELLNYGADRGRELCLGDADRNELQALISGAEICKPVLHPEDFLDRQCIQLYRYPYAVLSAQGEEVRLGEQTNGCDVPTDLCGQHAALLKTFAQKIVASCDLDCH